MPRLIAAVILAATVVQGNAHGTPKGCDFYGLEMPTGEWGLFADQVNCLCKDSQFVNCTDPIPRGKTPLGCGQGSNHMDWSPCDGGKCDRRQCWNGDWIKEFSDCPLPKGGSIPHGSAGEFGEEHCRCVGFTKETKLESCVSIASLAYAVFDPIALRTQLKSEDFKTRVEQRNFDENESVADLMISSRNNVVQGRENANTLGFVGNGISSSYFQVPPCSLNAPHIHPRATELLTIIEGSLYTQFSTENGGQIFRNHLQFNEATIFPSGLPHYQVNIGCTTARYLSVLNHEQPGVLTLTDTETVVSYSKNVGPTDREPARNMLQMVDQCFIDCNIPVPGKPMEPNSTSGGRGTRQPRQPRKARGKRREL